MSPLWNGFPSFNCSTRHSVCLRHPEDYIASYFVRRWRYPRAILRDDLGFLSIVVCAGLDPRKMSFRQRKDSQLLQQLRLPRPISLRRRLMLCVRPQRNSRTSCTILIDLFGLLLDPESGRTTYVPSKD